MPDEIQIITTGDGSHSLRNTALNETYHSVHGAKRESAHVFIDHGLKHRHERTHCDKLHIFEVGFGTGLNALLALAFAERHGLQLAYTAIEAFPLPEDLWKKLNYAETDADQSIFKSLHTATWNKEALISKFFHLLKISDTLQNVILPSDHFDVIFFDAFAPSKQPELWNISLLEKVFASMKCGGVFVTYCAKGQLKRDLRQIGFQVETLPGPPGKKEMVRALKIC